MGDFVKAAAVAEIPEGGKRHIKINGEDILLARVGGQYYALGNRCPHLGGNLAAGKLEGSIITCPLHGSQFDIRDGRVVRWTKGSGLMTALSKLIKPPRGLPVYNVRVEGDDILIEV
jgi:nitrite reductase/ring-hydroxylating ferredoxin subunit